MLALALWPDARQPRPQELPAPSFDIVFEGGRPEQAEAEPPPGLEAPPTPAAPMPPADVAALPEPPPVPPPPRTATSAVQPAPLAPVPPPLPPMPAPPLPAPATPQQPLAVPPPPPPPPPQPAMVEVPAPSPAQPPQVPSDHAAPEPARGEPLREAEAPPPPPPAPAASPRAAPRPQQQAALAMPPGSLFLAERLQLGRPTQSAGRPQARGTELLADPRMIEGLASADPSVRVSGAQVGADWRAAFRRWLDQNMRYPLRAIQLGESGTVRVQVVAAADGRVQSVRLTGPSVSPSLNVGTTFPFADAQLPPFPPPTDPDGVTIDLTVNYRLIRR